MGSEMCIRDRDMLEDWNPKPKENCFNILLLHQNIKPYVYSFLEEPTLEVTKLPKGFDLIVDGHVHTYEKQKIGSSIFLIPGSTLITQFQPSEAENPKGVIKVEIKKDSFEVKFEELETRKFFYEEVEGEGLREKIVSKIEEILKVEHKLKPIIRIKVRGKEREILDRELQEIERNYRERAILTFSKEVVSEEVRRKIELLRNLREQKKSIVEMGMEILKENLKELGFKNSFDFESIFKLLEEKEVEKALNIILGEQRTLSSWVSR